MPKKTFLFSTGGSVQYITSDEAHEHASDERLPRWRRSQQKSREITHFSFKKLLKANQHDQTFRFRWADLASDYAHSKRTTRNLPRTTEKPRDPVVVAFFSLFCRNTLFFSRKTYIITTTAWPIDSLFGSMLKTAFDYHAVKLLQ